MLFMKFEWFGFGISLKMLFSSYWSVITIILLLIILPKLYPLFISRPINRWTGKQFSLIQTLIYCNFLSFASYWNDYEVHNDQYITNNSLIIGFHSRSTFDNLYILAHLYPTFIASYFLFHIPFASTIFKYLGAIPSKGLNSSTTDIEFIKLLISNTTPPVLVLPGGSYEAYKPYHERYHVNWKDEPGFARLLVNYAIQYPDIYKIQIIPFYTKNSDDILYNHPLWYTISSKYARKALYEIRNGNYIYLFSLMFYGGLGLGFLPFPRPIKLDTYYGMPLKLKKGETSQEFGKRIQNSLQNLINKVNKLPILKKKKVSKSWSARGLAYLRYGYGILYGIYMLIQNFCFAIFGLIMTVVAVPAFLITGILQNYRGKKGKRKGEEDIKIED